MNTTQKQIWQIGDCLDLMKEMPDNSIDIVIADPPYYRIAGDDWDREWDTFQEYIDWLEVRCVEMKRVLKNNGSLYMFGDDHRIAYVQVMMDQHFTFLNHLVWYKRNNIAIKYASHCRSFVPVSERILFYSLQDATGLKEIHDTKECFAPIKEYMRGEYQKVMDANGFKTKAECDAYLNEITGTKSVVTRHYFADSQYCFPTLELYEKLQKTGFFIRNHDRMKDDYDALRAEYEEMRAEYEDLRRPFNYTKGMYEVFDIPIVSGRDNNSHSTSKPVEVIKRLLKTSMRPDSKVLDPFCGSGTTLEACMHLDLECVGIEIDPQWETTYRKRMKLDNHKLDEYAVEIKT